MNYSRREFTKLSALGIAAGLTPSLPAQQDDKKLRFCVIGLGTIAGHFMPGTLQSEHGKVVALVSGHRDKAEKIAAQYNVATSNIYNYENFDTIKDNKEIDAVYVALPNSMHMEYVIRAAKAGKHVICEKPMSINPQEGEQMIAACKAANVKLMIAYRMQYDPTLLKVKQLIADGSIGKVQTVIGTYGFSAPAPQWRLEKPLSGGGSLFDVGVYCINTTRFLIADEPEEFTGVASTIDKSDPGRFDTVEENIAWTMKFKGGALGSYNTTYGASTASLLQIQGSKGLFVLSPAFNYSGNHTTGFYRQEGQPRPTRFDEALDWKDPLEFSRQIDHFADCVWNNKQPRSNGEEGLRDVRYCEQIYAKAGIKLLKADESIRVAKSS